MFKTMFVIMILLSSHLLSRDLEYVLPSIEEVVVAKLDKEMPTEKWAGFSFIWNDYKSDTALLKFESYTIDNWEKNYFLFSDTLVSKAKASNLDYVSLSKVLTKIRKKARNSLAYLPVGAYQTTRRGRVIWIVIVLWEILPDDYGDGNKSESRRLNHIRSYAYDAKRIRKIEFATCM